MSDEALLFVYGTLRKSDQPFEMAKLFHDHTHFVSLATYQGQLFKIADYPGAVSSDDPFDRVYGEVYALTGGENLIPILDQYEECTDTYPEPKEYVRKMVQVTLENGAYQNAWMYLYNRPTQALHRIISGDFLKT